MTFNVRVNGQVLSALSRADIEQRSPAWVRAGATVEVEEQGSARFIPLDQFLTASAQPQPAGVLPAHFDPALYLVRVNDQVIGPFELQEVESRAARWQKAGISFEMAEAGTSSFAPPSVVLTRARAAQGFGQFRAVAPGPAGGPAVSQPIALPTPAPQFGPGPYWVRISGELLGPLTREEIETRSQRWPATPIEVAENPRGLYVELAVFLRMPRAVPVPAPAAVVANAPSGGVQPVRHPAVAAALGLITLNIYWLFWLPNTFKRIRQLNPNATKITPGKAVGFLFIPLFGPLWFIWIAFSLPRAIVRARGTGAVGHGFAPAAAGVMCLLGSLWIWGLGFAALPAQIAWIVGCESLFLGFIAYCQAMLNSAAYAAAGAPVRNREGAVLAAAAGLAAACAVLGLSFTIFPASRDITPVLQRAHELAGQGNFEAAVQELQGVNNPAAKYELSFYYKNGLGVKQDSDKAVSLLREAAEAGLADAQTTLGLWFATGEGVAADPAAAITWYRKAAAQGDDNGAILLGLAYAAGAGVEQDPQKAYMWFTVAANRGDAYALSEQNVAGELLSANQKTKAESDAATELEREAGGQSEK